MNCLRSAFYVFVGLLTISTASELAAQGTLQPGPPLVVVDGAGIEVGALLENNEVILQLDDRYFSLRISRDGFMRGSQILFVEPNCQGTGYIEYDWKITDPAGVAPGEIAYVGNAANAQGTTAVSYYSPSGECVNSGWTTLAVPADISVDLGSFFQPPFSVRPAQSAVVGQSVPAITKVGMVLFVVSIGIAAFFILRRF